jgi:hypothetical protein
MKLALTLLVALFGPLATAIGAGPQAATTSAFSISSPFITISVAQTGAYKIASSSTNWTFAGTVGHPLSGISKSSGTDSIDSYQEISFSYVDGTGASRGGGLRTYATRPAVLFIDSYQSAASNTSPFPRLKTYPQNLYHLTYRYAFAQPTFVGYGADSPWVFFDALKNTFVLSTASDFMIAATTKATNGAIASGITSAITTLPAGFAHETLLVIGQGINVTFAAWGHALTDLQNKHRPSNDVDVTLNTLGYWTDHGATYYYNYDPNLGYAGTLLAVRNSFQQAGIPLGYMQLDSWWYPKGSADTWSYHSGGIYTYTADATLFPQGLSGFQQQLGLPLLTQATYIDSSSPYRTEFTMAGNVSTDPRYWAQIAAYLQGSQVVSYEQDWLATRALPPTNLTDPNAFMNNMAAAMGADQITLQYSTALPRHFLQSSLYDNATTVRVSGDRFASNRWTNFLYASDLSGTLGIWPWSDVFMSAETDNLLLATLSAGVVGVGDAIGAESASNLFQTIRSDGVIVKPDAPIVPTDDVFEADAKGLNVPMVGTAYSDFGAGMRAMYLFAYARGSDTTATFTPSALGITGDAYVYNYFAHAGTVVRSRSAFTDTVTAGSYYIVVPIGPSGIGFLGDAGKFVSLGKKRVSQLSDTGSLHANVAFASGEAAVTLYGYSPTLPVVTATDGTVGAVGYNSSTHLFNVAVAPGADSAAVITLAQSGGG